MAFFSLPTRWGVEAETDAGGVAKLNLPASGSVPGAFEVVYIYPQHSFWPAYFVGQSVMDRQFVLSRLPPIAETRWWAARLGFDEVAPPNARRNRVKVAVVDTGVGPHPDLHIADGRNLTIHGGAAAYADVDGHGSHVAGIIAGSGDMQGVAPWAELYAARVFPAGDEQADSADIAAAIETAVDEWNCDIINLSLGGPYDPLIEDRINYAREQGVLCVAAAGNSAGPVEYPGALRHAFCIAALGMLETYPPGFIHEEAEPQSRGLYGLDRLYAASFTCFGTEVVGCAPGVAIVSTVPPTHYAALDGTSMACPMAAGGAATLLGRNAGLFGATRDAARADRIRAELQALLTDIRLPRVFQGGGLLKG